MNIPQDLTGPRDGSQLRSLTPTEAMMVGLTDQLYELTENEGDGSGITWGADNGMKLIDMMQFDE